MKFILKCVCASLIIGLLSISCKSLSQSKQNQDFIILNTKDTVFGKKIRLSRGFNKIGQVKVVKVSGEKLAFGYDEVYQTYKYRKDSSFYVEEMVMLSPNNPISYTLMDVIINKGKIKLYHHDPTRMPNIPFVVSNVYYGYVRNQREFKTLLSKLDACVAFRGKFSEKTQRTIANLVNLIAFYNANCE